MDFQHSRCLRFRQDLGGAAVVGELSSRPLYGLFAMLEPEAYECAVPEIGYLYIIGPYETPCGGCDAIQPYGLIPGLIRKYAARGHVLFEGLLIGDCYGKVGALLDQLSGEGVSSAVIRLNKFGARSTAPCRARR
jgi:hypothetical protein